MGANRKGRLKRLLQQLRQLKQRSRQELVPIWLGDAPQDNEGPRLAVDWDDPASVAKFDHLVAERGGAWCVLVGPDDRSGFTPQPPLPSLEEPDANTDSHNPSEPQE